MENQNNQLVKTGDWVVTMLITAIPLVGLIMLFVWAFSGSTIPSKANWAKATLIWMLISIVLFILLTLVFGVALFSVFG